MPGTVHASHLVADGAPKPFDVGNEIAFILARTRHFLLRGAGSGRCPSEHEGAANYAVRPVNYGRLYARGSRIRDTCHRLDGKASVYVDQRHQSHIPGCRKQ